jgi:hypothetical protein
MHVWQVLTKRPNYALLQSIGPALLLQVGPAMPPFATT